MNTTLNRWLSLVLAAVGLSCLVGAQAAVECDGSQYWPAWESMRSRMITPQGRVIDISDPRQITTSEGQSYALFFALVNNDRQLFQELLNWTEMHLAQDDLAVHLPAWLWGRNDEDGWGVLDENSAADSDLWIAYSLLEAGRLWDVREYTLLGHMLLNRIEQQEIVQLPGFGPVLLPGARGFVHKDRVVLNPSYVPPQLVALARWTRPDSVWSDIDENIAPFLIDTSPLGIAPDWIEWKDHAWFLQSEHTLTGSYDAIRVYLWIGMLADDASAADDLKMHFRKAKADLIDARGEVAELIDIRDGQSYGSGPVGFSAALLPLFGSTELAESLRNRVVNSDPDTLGYYGLMLRLFGEGWDQNRFAFDANGSLIPWWWRCK